MQCISRVHVYNPSKEEEAGRDNHLGAPEFKMQSRLDSPQGLRRGRLTLCWIALFCLIAGSASANVQIILEKKDGDKISDVATIVVKALSNDGIDKVEFRVDDQLKSTDTSTPYTYDWDTIVDTEGEHTLSITAYDSNGVSKRTTVKLVIDNEIGGGVAGVLEKARAALADKDYEATVRFCRRVIKAEPTNVEGARALAGAYSLKKDWNRAVAALEKAPTIEESLGGMQDMAYYRIQRALLPENSANFFNDFVKTDETKHKIGTLMVKEAIKKSATDSIGIGDALYNSGRFAEAVAEYQKVGSKEESPKPAIARLALAYIAIGQYDQAQRLIRPIVRAKKDDASLRAVYALSLLHTRQPEEARAILDKDLADQVPASLIVGAFTATLLGKRREAVGYAQDAVSLVPKASEAHYALALASSDLRLAEAEMLQTMAMNSAHPGPLLNYAGRIATSKRTDRYELSLNLTDFVLKAYPESFQAKQLQALIYLQTKKIGDAEPLLRLLIPIDGKAPDFMMTLAVYYEVKGDGAQSVRMLEQIRKVDPKNFDNVVTAPSPIKHIDYINRVWLYRAGFYLNPSTLFASKDN